MDRPAPDRVLHASALLLDLDGVLYVEDEPIAGAIEAVAALRDRGLRLRFVTNTTSRPRRDILARLERLGMPVPERELITPARLAVEHCLAAGRQRALLLMRDEVKADLAGPQEVREGSDVVVVGDLGEDFGYGVLNKAFRELLAGAELVALQKNRYWRTPSPVSTVAKKAGAVMVGDDVESDVGGALRAGLAGVLVRTGKYRPEAVAASGVEPTATVDSIADVPALLGA